ncbi:pilus assembly protein TadG-related protein [Pusillimonas sp.]|uniref:TadE/TadG family type IV pilus assembly protein n=1 Tax=Pusillimonas sp. TaxID=3040095 RepID=UPI0037C5258C
MTRHKPLRNLFRQLRRDERGGVALTFLVSTTVLLGGSFGAIDLIRYNVAQNRLQNSLDAAAISAGRNLANRTPTPGTPEAEAWVNDARNFFSSNMPNRYLGSSVLQDDLQISYREERTGIYITGQFVEMSAVGDLPLISTGFLKVTSFDLAASNQAVRRTRNDLEVVMALDNSGSMDRDSPSRLSVLKTAAKDLAATILGATSVPGASQRVFVGLVPFTDVVNVRDYALDGGWLSHPAVQQNYLENRWSGCIVEPKGNWSSSNPAPAQALAPDAGFQPLHLTYSYDMTPNNLPNHARLAASTAGNPNPVAFNGLALNRDRRIVAKRQSDTEFRVNLAVDTQYCLEGKARFLNNQQAAMESAIDAMVANGGTGVPVGLQWAWRMLHPAWRGAWGDNEMPRDPEPAVLSKVIVLLSDGQNEPVGDGRRQVLTNQNNNRRAEYQLVYRYQECAATRRGSCTSWETAERQQSVNVDVTAPTHGSGQGQCPAAGLRMLDPIAAQPNNYSSTSGNCNNTANSIGYGGSNRQNTAAYNSYMAQLCTNVKTDGNDIKVYTVTLGNDLPESARTLMRSCSSGAGYYYNAQNVNDLPQVFASIAGALTELRLTR